MRKTPLLLICLLCLALALPGLALDLPLEIGAKQLGGSYLLGACVYQGQLLLRSDSGLYAVKEGEAPQLIRALPLPFLEEEPGFGPLLCQGDLLFGYHPFQGKLYPLHLSEAGLSLGPGRLPGPSGPAGPEHPGGY